MSHDIKGNIAVPYTITNTINHKFCCEFSFFNYGEDIRLFNGCDDDTFISGIGTIRYAYVLKMEDNIEYECAVLWWSPRMYCCFKLP